MKKIGKLISALACFSLYAHAFGLTLESSSLAHVGTIPVAYTCKGKNISPALAWKDAPKNTQSFALILSDPDAPSGTFYHWVLFNLPANTTGLSENITSLPAGTQVGKNSYDAMGYKGPCPPPGSTHHYIFSLYALNTTLNLPSGANAEAVSQAMQNHILDTAELKHIFGN